MGLGLVKYHDGAHQRSNKCTKFLHQYLLIHYILSLIFWNFAFLTQPISSYVMDRSRVFLENIFWGVRVQLVVLGMCGAVQCSSAHTRVQILIKFNRWGAYFCNIFIENSGVAAMNKNINFCCLKIGSINMSPVNTPRKRFFGIPAKCRHVSYG